MTAGDYTSDRLAVYCAGFPQAAIIMQVDFLVLDRPPQALHQDIVRRSPRQLPDTGFFQPPQLRGQPSDLYVKLFELAFMFGLLLAGMHLVLGCHLRHRLSLWQEF